MNNPNETNTAATNTAAATGLPGFISIAGESIELYKRFWKPLAKLQLLTSVGVIGIGILTGIIIALAAAAVASVGGYTPVTVTILSVVAVACLIVILAFIYWIEAASIVVLRDANEKISLGSSLNSAKQYIFPCFLASLASSLAIFVGLIFFIIPGLVFSVWLMFANFIIIVENKKWLAALARSRDYARMFFWNVFLLIVLGVVSILFVNSVLELLQKIPFGTVINFVASILIAPIFPIYFFSIYNHLKRIKREGSGDTQAASKPTGKNFILGLAMAGVVAVFALIGLVVYYAPEIEKGIKEYNQNNPNQQVPELPFGTDLR